MGMFVLGKHACVLHTSVEKKCVKKAGTLFLLLTKQDHLTITGKVFLLCIYIPRFR